MLRVTALDGANEIGNLEFSVEDRKKFEKEAMSEIVENYVKTGKVKIVFKDYAFLGPDSDTAGITGRAVWELYPEKYWEWREAMFTAQDEEHGGFGDEISVMKLTIEIPGIDGAKIAQAIKDKNDAYRALMEGDRAEGANAFGINGTPAVITGEELLSGLLPYSAYKEVLDEELK